MSSQSNSASHTYQLPPYRRNRRFILDNKYRITPASGVEGFTQTVEGKTKLLVPPSSLKERVPPKVPAFFNPAAKLNRDLSVLAYRAFLPMLQERTLADGF